MRFFLSVVFAFFTSVCFCAEIIDGDGRVLQISENPRIVPITPVVAEIIFELGAEKNLVVLPSFVDNRGKQLDVIGSAYGLDWERIIKLSPDVVISSFIQDKTIQKKCEQFGIRFVYMHKEGLQNIPKDIRLLGKICGKQRCAEELATNFEREISFVSIDKKIPAFFLMATVAAGKGSYISDIMKLCGFENCADKTGSTWPVLAREFILKENPEALFVAYFSEFQKKTMSEFLHTDSAWKNVNAVKKSKIYFIPISDIILPDTRVLRAIKTMRNAKKDFQ